MDEADTQSVNYLLQFAGKCSGPTGAEFVGFQNSVQQLVEKIQTQAAKLAALSPETEIADDA